ncbi:MAG TPA: hypothetical protein VMQ83_11285, partial [Gammaproteobacteria bacterium]|nr:hypothetical protein [Gammaproteobacteria bacterium]
MTTSRSGIIRHSSSVSFAILAVCLLAPHAAANPIAELQSRDGGAGVVASATGGGHFLVGGALDVKFSFSAVQQANGAAHGKSRHSVVLQDQLIEFFADVTCVSVDTENGRAWIGGVVLRNNSEHPAFTTERTQPGRDIWFRVLDSGEGLSEADRSTFVGFEGDADVITSLEYCAVQPWPADNARTSPVVQGNIQV